MLVRRYMLKRVGWLPVMLVAYTAGFSSAGCGVETVDGGGGSGDQPRRIPNTADPSYDQRLDDLEIICASTLRMGGTFEPSAPAPEAGCWPAGIWHVSAALDFRGCDPQPAFPNLFELNVIVDEDGIVTEILDVNDPDNERVVFAVSENGGELCDGQFDYFSTNNHVTVLRPLLNNADNTISGAGEYAVYSFDPF
jgi:hypothetical protein